MRKYFQVWEVGNTDGNNSDEQPVSMPAPEKFAWDRWEYLTERALEEAEIEEKPLKFYQVRAVHPEERF